MKSRIFRYALAFIAIFTLAFDASAATNEKPAKKSAQKPRSSQTKPAPAEPYPAYKGNGAPTVQAASALLIDAQSGKILFERNADEERAVASTQKLLTALIVAEAGNLDEIVTVQEVDTRTEPSMLYLKTGERYRRGDLLRILLVKSMNDVARCLARDNAGSIDAFSDKMNSRAATLGMRRSHFENPNGLPLPGQHSCARDMAKVALAAYHNRTIRSIVCMKQITWKRPNGRVTVYKNTNRVLQNYPLCNGMKTGYTEAAGHCLISSASNDGREVISVVLGDKAVWVDSYRLLSWGLAADRVAQN